MVEIKKNKGNGIEVEGCTYEFCKHNENGGCVKENPDLYGLLQNTNWCECNSSEEPANAGLK